MADESAAVAPPTLDREKMRTFGIRISERFEQYKKDRRETELQWLRNMRQFRGIYDPEVLKKIDDDQSQAYPKITRTKVIGTLARLMEMMFPQTEKNWGIVPGPMPDLATEDVQAVLDKLVQEKGGPDALDDAMIEKGIRELAKEKAERMSVRLDDYLSEMEYITLARKVIFSGVLYSAGVLKGPMTVKRKKRTWNRDSTGKWVANEVMSYAPSYEFTPVWDWYPDLSAKTFAQMDGSFFRHIMSRNQLAELKDRPDFIPNAVKDWMGSHTSGNYKELHWEQELRTKGDRKNLTDLTGRKYEVGEWWGAVSGHDLKACGISVTDDQLSSEFEAQVWFIDNAIIKCKLNPFKKKSRMAHVFVYEEDDINLLGTGVPQIIRDSQLAICEATRMLLDNASVICGPMLEMNSELLVPGQSPDIHAFKVFVREGTGADAGVPAVRPIQVDGHLAELQGIVQMFRDMADTETALPPQALGDVTRGGSEALRTQGNLSMLMGAAALPIRDTVRNFDAFTISFINSLYQWEMEFGDDPAEHGDYNIIARGSTSLIAKEVRSINIDQFMQSLSPEERVYLNTEKLLMERMKTRDLPIDLLEDKDVVAQKLKEQADRSSAQEDRIARKIEAEIKELVSSAFKDFALAVKSGAQANAETFKTIGEVANAGNTEGAGSGAA